MSSNLNDERLSVQEVKSAKTKKPRIEENIDDDDDEPNIIILSSDEDDDDSSSRPIQSQRYINENPKNPRNRIILNIWFYKIDNQNNIFINFYTSILGYTRLFKIKSKVVKDLKKKILISYYY